MFIFRRIHFIHAAYVTVTLYEVYVDFFGTIRQNKKTWKYFWINRLINITELDISLTVHHELIIY
jgi:hypothetical protein